jgi:hypothetical protein
LSVLLLLVAPSAQRGAQAKQRKRKAPRSEKGHAEKKESRKQRNREERKYVEVMSSHDRSSDILQ